MCVCVCVCVCVCMYVCVFAVKQQILRFQSPTTGLFPADLSQPNSCEAHVRDSIYCAVAVWSLAQAYKCVHIMPTSTKHYPADNCNPMISGLDIYIPGALGMYCLGFLRTRTRPKL